MKNKLYIIGLLSLILIVGGGVFKIMHWPGASILLILGKTSLCFVFFPFAIRSSFLDGGKKKTALYIAAFITLFVDFVGSLFKIMHWPGANWLLIFGITFPAVVFLPVYIYFHIKEKEKSLVNFMYVMFLLVYLGVMSALLAVNVQKEVLSDSVRLAYIADNSDYLDLKNTYLYQSIEKDNISEEVKTKTDEIIWFINETRKNLALESKGNRNAISVSSSINYWQLEKKDDFNIPEKIMMKDSENGETGRAYILKRKIEDYKTFLLSVSDNEENVKNNINQLLFVKDKDYKDYKISWEDYYFHRWPLIFVLKNLESLEDDILQAESEVLAYLHNKETR